MAFAAFLDHIGAPTYRHFHRLGMPSLCDDPSAFVPLTKAWAFFDATAQSEDPMVGWHVGRFAGDHLLSKPFLRNLETAPTLYQALKRLIRLISAEASHLQLGILERRDDVLFYAHYTDMKHVAGHTSSQAYQLAVYIDLIRHFVGKRWVPHEIGMEYPVVPSVVEEHFPAVESWRVSGWATSPCGGPACTSRRAMTSRMEAVIL
jgi:hypothetical protein